MAESIAGDPFWVWIMSKPHSVFSDGLIMGLVIFVVIGIQTVSESKAKDEKILPAMAEAAAQGKLEAVLWMFKHDSSDYTKLKVAVDNGQPESMWLYSQYLRKQGDTAGADQLRARAAEKGFVDAIVDLQTPTPTP